MEDDLGSVTKVVTYTYGPDDLLLTKSVDLGDTGTANSAERYLYDGDQLVVVFDDLELATAANARDAIKNRYLHGPAVDMILADEQYDPSLPAAPGSVLWPLADHQGTVRDLAEFDDVAYTTALVNHIEYDSFGQITAETDPSVDYRFGFTGRDWDADVDLYFYRARWYDAQAGQFLSASPPATPTSAATLATAR